MNIRNRLNKVSASKRTAIQDTTATLDMSSNNLVLETKVTNYRTLSGTHKAPVYAADFGGGKFDKNMVTGGKDPELVFWDFTRRQVEKQLTFYHKPEKKSQARKDIVWVSDVSWEKETGEVVATSFVDGTVAVYEVNWGTPQNYVVKPGYKNKNHFGIVNSVSFLHHRKHKLASGGVDGIIRVHDVLRPEDEDVIFAHASSITSLTTNKNEPNILVSCSSDETCKVWDVRKMKELNCFADLNSGANTVCFSPGGNSFAVGCDDGSCRLYDWRYGSGEITTYYDDENRPEPIDNVCFAADGKLLIATYGSTIVSCNALSSESDSPFEKFDYSVVEDKKGSYITRLVSHDTLGRFATTSVDRSVKVWKISPLKKD